MLTKKINSWKTWRHSVLLVCLVRLPTYMTRSLSVDSKVCHAKTAVHICMLHNWAICSIWSKILLKMITHTFLLSQSNPLTCCLWRWNLMPIMDLRLHESLRPGSKLTQQWRWRESRLFLEQSSSSYLNDIPPCVGIRQGPRETTVHSTLQSWKA